MNKARTYRNRTAFAYDANGNMTDWSTPSGPVTAAYDIDNRMKNITTPNVTETYRYGPGNLRVRKSQGGITTYSVYGQGGELLGTYNQCSVAGTLFLCDARLRVYFGGRLIVNGWAGVKPDRLGSPDGTHGRVYPYGEVAGSVTTDQEETFTTDTRDGYTGLDYAKNRYYAYSWGRFLTADPYRASGREANPGSWNRYAYVENEPVNLEDPNGLQAAGPIFYCEYIEGSGCITRIVMPYEPGSAPAAAAPEAPEPDPNADAAGHPGAAVALLKAALNDPDKPDCRGLFSAGGIGPVGMLDGLLDGSLGSITFEDIRGTTDATAQAITSQRDGTWSSELGGWMQVDITINSRNGMPSGLLEWK